MLEESEIARVERKQKKLQDKLVDKKYTEEYISIMEQQELAKREKREDIKRKIENQITDLPSKREMNIYGFSVQEEEKFIFNKMKEEEAQDKTKLISKGINKKEKQKELREFLDLQLKEKEKSKVVEKVGNEFFHNQVINDKNDFDASEKNK